MREEKSLEILRNVVASSRGRRLEVWRKGVVIYAEALVLQNELVQKRRVGMICDTLLYLQHPPTFTIGKRRTLHNLLSTPAVVRSTGAEIYQISLRPMQAFLSSRVITKNGSINATTIRTVK